MTDAELLHSFIVHEQRVTRALLIYLLAKHLDIDLDMSGRRVRKFLRKHRDDYRFAGGVLYAPQS
jgi:hypothetical protein